MNYRIIVANATIILLWGSAFAGIRYGLSGYSPEHLSFLRLLIGAVGLMVYAAATRMRLPELKDLPAIFVFGLLGFAVYQTWLSYGEQTVDAGTASLLVSTSPIMIGILGKLFLKEKTGKWYWIGAAICSGGVFLISAGSSRPLEAGMGIIWILGASLSESIYFVFQKRYLDKYGALPFTAYTIWAATIIMAFFSPGIGMALNQASVGATLSAVYLGVFPTVIAYFALAYITKKTGASEAASSLYLTPAASFLIAWVWLGETPTTMTIIGGFITLAGVSFTFLEDRNRGKHLNQAS